MTRFRCQTRPVKARPFWTLFVFACGCLSGVTSVQACSVCTGAAADPMTRGMQVGIGLLLVVTVGVLAGFGTFFIRLARRGHNAVAGGVTG